MPLKPSPEGTLDWGTGTTLPNGPTCDAGPNSSSQKLCNGNSLDMTMVIRHPTGTVAPFEPVIYATTPDVMSNTSATCTGDEWDVSAAIKTATSNTKYGWVCAVAKAFDTAGNPGVSAPLRICLEDNDHPCQLPSNTAPSCTDGCIAPPHFHTRPVLNK